MTKNMKKILALFIVSCLSSWFLFTSSSFGQVLPKPGEIIDKSNYKDYKHLFSEDFGGWFENGWGLVKPLSIKVSETKPNPIPKAYLAFSEKNRGKYTIDKDGFIAGGYDYLGLPFPGVTKDDKDFATKLMWNYEYRYWFDNSEENTYVNDIRKGERTTWWEGRAYWYHFFNRLYVDPKPIVRTPSNLYKALRFVYVEPTGMKNLMFLNWRYLDVKKSDDIYLYLPTLRRVLRGEAGQRSAPIQGSTNSLDEFNVWDGRVPEFTYEFVGEQKVLGISDNKWTEADVKARLGKAGLFFIPTEGWEIKDVYVIDIKSKDSKYPQGKKRIYVDKENGTSIYFTTGWDRAGKVWKIFNADYIKYPLPDGDRSNCMGGYTCVDVQFGLISTAFIYRKLNPKGYAYGDFLPATLLRLAR